MHCVAQCDTAFPQGDAATEIEDHDSVYLAGCYFHAHASVSLGSSRRLGRRSVFDKSKFGPGMQLAKVYLIHERFDEEDAAAGTAEDIFRGEWVGNVGGIKTGSF